MVARECGGGGGGYQPRRSRTDGREWCQRLLVRYQSLPLQVQIFSTQDNASNDSKPIYENCPSFTDFRL